MQYILKKEILAPVIIIIISFLLCILVKKVVKKLLNKKNNSGKQKTIANLISNIIMFIIFAIAALTILEIFGIDTKSILASLGVLGLVVGLAIQDILKDFIAGISFVVEGQFSIGDFVKINDFKGEVIASNLRSTKLKAFSGEVKIISNRNILELINYSLEKANLIVDIGVAYESDIEKVKKVLDNLSEELKDKYKLSSIECLGIQDLSSSSIVFRIVAQTAYNKQFELDRNIKKEIVLCFEKNNITIPYNQVVVHNG